MGMTLEDNPDGLVSFVDGSYLRVMTSLPSLLVATSSGSLDIDSATGASSFIID